MAEIESVPAGELVSRAESSLRSVSACARLEAELLLAASTGLARSAILAYPERAVAPAAAERHAAMVRRRTSGEPLAYILGRREFFSLELAVDRAVLVPRPETETLVELVLGLDLPAGASVLDLGTGSGAIALALKSARPDLAVTGIDCSPAALEIAARNGRALGLDVSWRHSDWFSALAGLRFDGLVANPPYVPSSDPHFAAGLRHEPRLALDGGADGLDAYRAILSQAHRHLAAGGRVCFEHGYDQEPALAALAAGFGFAVAARVRDLAGLPRALALKQADAG